MGTDKDWEKWGATDPYFGVLSSERFHANKVDAEAKRDFFLSGEEHVEYLLATIRNNFDAEFIPRNALDFGCGVGRVAIPLAKYAERVVGVDISTSMIAEARKNCESLGVNNIAFVLSDDNLSLVTENFDLIHSYIVLQHIPWLRGRRILQSLAERVEPGGYLSIHFLTSCNASQFIRALVRMRYVFPPLNWGRNAIKRRPLFEPAMQLHVYNLQDVLNDLKARNFATTLQVTTPSSDAFEFSSVFLFARCMPPNTSLSSP
jgi:SAM-dependent methyltransferase